MFSWTGCLCGCFMCFRVGLPFERPWALLLLEEHPSRSRSAGSRSGSALALLEETLTRHSGPPKKPSSEPSPMPLLIAPSQRRGECLLFRALLCGFRVEDGSDRILAMSWQDSLRKILCLEPGSVGRRRTPSAHIVEREHAAHSGRGCGQTKVRGP